MTEYSYQLKNDLLLGDTSSILTPTGLNDIGEVGLYLSHFIGNYKGGRNESYMYGTDRETM
jgi:hypothetical protein